MTITGELPTVQGVIYRCPVRTLAVIQSIIVVNDSGGVQTATLYVNDQENVRPITPVDVNFEDGALLEDIKVRTLKFGQNLEGVASGADLTYVIEVNESPE